MNTFMQGLKDKRNAAFENTILLVICCLDLAAAMLYAINNYSPLSNCSTALSVLVGCGVVVGLLLSFCGSCNNYDKSHLTNNKSFINYLILLVRLAIKINILFCFIGLLISPLFFYFAHFYILITVVMPNLALAMLIVLFLIPSFIIMIIKAILKF